MINIKKGLNLAVAGAPSQSIEDGRAIRNVAVLGDDYPGMKPTMAVAEGDVVEKGQVLFSDKKTAGVVYTAPAAGKVTAINRGAKRVLKSVVIEVDGNAAKTFTQVDSAGIASLERQVVVDQMVESGLWVALRNRPYAKVPSPQSSPNSIFVTAMDSNPLAADASIVIADKADEFSAGLDILAKLSDGPIHVCHESGKSVPSASAGNLSTHEFSGPHPSGLAGTHIHFIDPVSANKTVWYIGYQDVIAVGHLFLTGTLLTDRVISLAGPGVSNPRLVRTQLGASIDELTAGELADGQQRVISGSILAGHKAEGSVAFLGRYHQQISVLPEDKERRLFGYLTPGLNKHSVFPTYFSKWLGEKNIHFTTTTNGSPRAMVPIGTYDAVMPMDILATQLMRALLVNDLETAINLGCLELDEEDIALCTYACPGKYEYGPVLRHVLDQIEKEG